MACFNFRSFGLVRFCFGSACRHHLDCMNIVKFFPFVADILLGVRCAACVSAVKIELHF